MHPPPDVAARYVAGLTELDPGLTVNRDRAVRRGCNSCFDIAAGKAAATVLNNTRLRFDGGNACVDADQAARILDVIRVSGLLFWYQQTDQASADTLGWSG